MIQTLLVFVGGGLGAAARHGVNIAAARLFGVGFPWGTVIVNVAGSLVMGLIVAWLAFRGGGGLDPAYTPLPDDGIPRRLHHVLGVLARRGAALGTRRPWPRGGLCCRLGGAVDRRPVPRAVAGTCGVVSGAGRRCRLRRW